MARRIIETGRLMRGSTGLVLVRDDGGTWQLDAPKRAESLLGYRVEIIAHRSGFDRLSAIRITSC